MADSFLLVLLVHFPPCHLLLAMLEKIDGEKRREGTSLPSIDIPNGKES